MGWTTEHGLPHSYLLEMDPDDRAKIVAYLLESAERCDMCGTASWEWEENRFAYEPIDSFCHGCYVKTVFSDTGSDSLPGTTVSLVPNDQWRKAERQVAVDKQRARESRDRKAEDGGPGPAADS